MSPRARLIVALVIGATAGVVARALGITDLLATMVTVVAGMILFLGGGWWVGNKPGN